jgi:hypothetical protein
MDSVDPENQSMERVMPYMNMPCVLEWTHSPTPFLRDRYTHTHKGTPHLGQVLRIYRLRNLSPEEARRTRGD